MDYEKTIELIDANRDKVDFGAFGDGVAATWIAKGQQRLGVQFPPSFVWWLTNYGGGEINGDEIFSIYERDFDEVVGGDIVYMNELYRSKGFATKGQLLIQKNDFGEVYFLALNERDTEEECPIYVAPEHTKYADNFLQFLEKKINE